MRQRGASPLQLQPIAFMARFFSEQRLTKGICEIRGPEAHHLIHVRRLHVGDMIEVFDASGNVANAKVHSTAPDLVRVDVVQLTSPTTEPAPLVMAVAFPKGERQKWLIEKCVELGVTRLVPLQSTRGVALPTTSAVDRWRRQVIAASKQSGQSHMLEIDEPQAANEFFAKSQKDHMRLLADGRGQPWPTPEQVTLLCPFLDSSPQEVRPSFRTLPVAIAVGPEGGWTPDEREHAEGMGWRPTRLGDLTLRVETAVLAFAAAVQAMRHA